jgi:hypothetical protein
MVFARDLGAYVRPNLPGRDAMERLANPDEP